MGHNQEESSCRICLTADEETLQMWPLFEVSIERKTPAAIIHYCFGIEVSENEQTNEICENCKSDLEAAHRFLNHLRPADEKLETLTPKIEMGIFHDTEVYITEVEIKTEAFDEQNDAQSDEQSENEEHTITELIYPKRPRKSSNEDVSPPKEEPKPKIRKIPLKTVPITTESPYSSEDDHIDESDYEQNMSSYDDDDEDDRGKPAPKRLYYGVKSNSQPKRCCSCKEPLDSHEKAQKHSETYHLTSRITNPKEFGEKVFECPVCYKRFDTKMLFLQHQRKMYVDVLHPCPRCEEEFANLFVLKKHIKFDHKKKFIVTQLEEMRSKANICCGCKERFLTTEALKEHVERTHYRERVLSETSNTFECDVCYHRFKTYKSLKHHQLRFFKEKKFVCTLCGKFFREKVRLAEHENLHRKIATFQCAYCPAKFAIKNSYEVHVKMHDAEERYNCEYCGKGFRKKSLLMGHLQIHDTDRPFKCHLCPITFTRQNLLDAHLLAHSGSKPHKCKQCAASYIHQRDLRRHIREKHEGIRSFKCHLCPKAYIRQKLLDTHLKTHDD
ncbi:zinc finger protein 883-like [Ochlerotatus camptorhynchus]|uniref:zinc finger protein 883-like n=1 Tax=Ochlerotatus camptorhynchus TaxID=644619 RepID=UPI0031DFDCBC